MYASVLHDPAFFRFLTQIDAQLAAEARERRCPECAGPLHVANFPRKPRGCPASVREEYSFRLSFTCGRCDARTTPASVRFLGRRVYVAVMLMLASPPDGSATDALAGLIAVPVHTVRRWRRWWQEDFKRTAFWRSVREGFAPPVATEGLPRSLLERFQGRNQTTDTRIFSPDPNPAQLMEFYGYFLQGLWNISTSYAEISP